MDIDAEHAGLLECLDRLQLYIEKGHGYAASFDAIRTLEKYVVDHFAHEEAFLAERKFPNLVEHIKQHRAISEQVAKLYECILQGGEIEHSLIDFMRQWIVKHIGVEDMEFAVYFGTARK